VPEKEGEAAAREGGALAEAAFFARHLAMEPANRLPPAGLAAEASRIAEESGAAVRILDEKELEKEGLAAILAVGSGSVNPPRLIELAYDGSPGGATTIALVGKGVTFDSGGLSLKPADRMVHMKYDMSGAAAVLAAIRGAAKLALPIRVVAVVPSAENMPGPHSYRPGDVIASYKKTTIEVDNTDAEGRLLLADGLAWTEERIQPDMMIDVATLTGACKIALGRHAAGLFTNDDDLASDLTDAAAGSGDRLWRLPLWDSYDKELKSEVADLKNVGRASFGGGAVVAARFLARFVERTAWAHVDIAGMAWSDGKRDLGPAGSTGFGAALLLAYLVGKAGS
jgi:leucyl aminopeptidase